MKKLIAVFMIAFLLLIFSSNFINAQGDWWDSDWIRRRSITVTAGVNGVPENYQIGVLLTYDSDMAFENFQDSRFIWENSSGNYECPFWFETVNLGENVENAWIKLPDDVSLSEDQSCDNLKWYYGNASAGAAENGDAVFPLIEPYDSATLDTDRWPSVDGNPSYTINTTDHYIEITDMDADEWETGKGFHSKSISLPTEWRFEAAYGSNGANIYMNSTLTEITGGVFIVHHGNWSSADFGIAFCGLGDGWVDETSESRAGVGGNKDYFGGYSSHPQEFTSAWLMHKLSGSITIKEDGVQRVSEANSETPSIFHLGISRPITPYVFGTVRFHAFKIRAYVTPEPTASVGDEEEYSLPEKPILVSPENEASTTDNTPTFTWIGGTYADNHRVEVDNDNDFSSVIDNVVVDITDNSWTKSPDGYTVDNYYWRVWAINEIGENMSENTWTFEILAVPPPPPPSWDETVILFFLIVLNLVIIIGVKIPMLNFSFGFISIVIGAILLNAVGSPYINLLLFIVGIYTIYEGIKEMR